MTRGIPPPVDAARSCSSGARPSRTQATVTVVAPLSAGTSTGGKIPRVIGEGPLPALYSLLSALAAAAAIFCRRLSGRMSVHTSSM